MVNQAIQEYEKAPVFEFNYDTAFCKGSAEAPLVIMEFADFNCGHCSRMVHTLKFVEKNFSGKLQVCFKQYPLDSACNPNASRTNKET